MNVPCHWSAIRMKKPPCSRPREKNIPNGRCHRSQQPLSFACCLSKPGLMFRRAWTNHLRSEGHQKQFATVWRPDGELASSRWRSEFSSRAGIGLDVDFRGPILGGSIREPMAIGRERRHQETQRLHRGLSLTQEYLIGSPFDWRRSRLHVREWITGREG